MSMRISLRFSLLVIVLLAFASAMIAAPTWTAAPDEVALTHPTSKRTPGSALDEDYTQLRYVKTTDYGATWTVAQAGDLSAFAPQTEGFGDYSAVVMDNGELCYVIYLINATTPGVYAMAGPSFTPVMVMAEGDNDLQYGYDGPGHAQISKAPNGGLICTIWGATSGGANTIWAAKSTDNGATWGTPWIAATEPAMPALGDADDGYYKMPARSSADYAWCQFQIAGDEGYDQYVLVIPHNPGAAGTVVEVGDYAGHPFSYMFGGCKPIAYDQTDHGDGTYLYVTFRNEAADGILVYASNDMGMTWTFQTDIPFASVRYPTVALETTNGIPYVIGGETVGSLQPGEEQCMFWTYDGFGYNGGAWEDLTESQCTTLHDENTAGYYSMYVPQLWWWDADHAVQTYNTYTNFLQGEVLQASRTTDGGATWVDFVTPVSYIDDGFNAGTMRIAELCGGDDGLAYLIFSAAEGVTDEVPMVVGPSEILSDVTALPPYVFRTLYTDNVLTDAANSWLNWGDASGVTIAYITPDSVQYTDEATQSGWFYYTLPDTALGGLSQGQNVYIYFDGYDFAGNYTSSDETIVVVGVEWQDVPDRVNSIPGAFELKGNYPNPFNPTTTIEFTVPADMAIDLKVYNTLGQEVATLADNVRVSAGTYSYEFNASALSSGVYFYTLSNGISVDSKKMILVK